MKRNENNKKQCNKAIKMIKKISTNEYEFLQELKKTDIIPEVTILQKNKVGMKKYPLTLQQYIESGGNVEKYKKKIDSLIHKLHEMNIFHGDLHTENIVLDSDNGDVRLIDFGESIYIDQINEYDINHFNDFLDPMANIGKKFETIDDMLEYELNSWKLTLTL
jgi:tRNA A-37 threonylcarbamoyl transferase component Bud32